MSPEQWDATYTEAYRRIADALARGKSVVYDETNFLRAQRDAARAIAARCGAATRLIWVTAPEATARARWQTNRRASARYDVRDEDFEQVVRRFEEPTEDERALLYDGVSPVEAWLASVGISNSHRDCSPTSW
ncbi:MAG TPA: AAA family ATPase [Ktedonobacterales bacterium]